MAYCGRSLLKWWIVLFVLLNTTSAINETTKENLSLEIVKKKINLLMTQTLYGANCTYDMDVSLFTAVPMLRRKCCSDIFQFFRRNWVKGSVNLSDLLRSLKIWKCPHFESECAIRSFAFSEFNRLTYERFCNETAYYAQCREDIEKILGENQVKVSATNTNDSQRILILNEPSTNDIQSKASSANNLHRLLRSQKMDLAQMSVPCIQAGLIDTVNRSSGRFFEIKETQIPMCGILWQGFMENAFTTYSLSEWVIMPSRCQVNIVVVMVIAAMLGFGATFANITVLVVFSKNKKLRDSQGVYKMSLGCSDLLTGLFVFPTVVNTVNRGYISTNRLIDSTWNNFENDQNGIGLYLNSFSQHYLNFVGFFTNLSLAVSVYTLTIASFDRFMVVFRPMRYNAYSAKTAALRLVVCVWILALIFAILPILNTGLKYRFMASVFISFSGPGAIYVFLIAFVIPLITVWIVNIATFIYSKKNAKVRPKIRKADDTVHTVNIENRLFRTLAIMVVAFSACIVPIAVAIIVHILLSGIHPSSLETLIPERLTMVTSLELVGAIVLMSNSIWNFFIYNVRSHEFRSSSRKAFSRLQDKIKSRLFRDSAKEARNRRTSAAVSQNLSQIHSTNVSTLNS